MVRSLYRVTGRFTHASVMMAGAARVKSRSSGSAHLVPPLRRQLIRR